MLGISDDHLRQFLERAFGQFHGSDWKSFYAANVVPLADFHLLLNLCLEDYENLLKVDLLPLSLGRKDCAKLIA